MIVLNVVLGGIVLALVVAFWVAVFWAAIQGYEAITGYLLRVPVRYLQPIHVVAVVTWAVLLDRAPTGWPGILGRIVAAAVALGVVRSLVVRLRIRDLSEGPR